MNQTINATQMRIPPYVSANVRTNLARAVVAKKIRYSLAQKGTLSELYAFTRSRVTLAELYKTPSVPDAIRMNALYGKLPKI